MRIRIAAFLSVLLFVVLAGSALATPIVYLGTLVPNVPVSGNNLQIPGDFDNPVGADYWNIFATAGHRVDIVGDRQAVDYDMAMWIFRGTFTDTDQFGAFFSASDAGFIGFFDDEEAPNIPGGPFGDPRAFFLAPVTGFYTIAVTNNLSFQDPPNPYTLTSVPEPASMLLLGGGLAGVAAAARRRWSS